MTATEATPARIAWLKSLNLPVDVDARLHELEQAGEVKIVEHEKGVNHENNNSKNP